MDFEIKSTAPKPFIFVLMPFDEKFDNIYYGIKHAAEDAGAYAERVDKQIFSEGILDRIFNQISKADVIIGEMTGRNPNVFYEVGYAHAIGKIVLLLTQNAEDIPFDLKYRQHIVHNGKIETLHTELTRRIIWAINESKKQGVKNISERFFISIFGKEIPESQFSLEIPSFKFTEVVGVDLPIFIRNDSLEPTPPINHIYLITSYDSSIFPLRETMKKMAQISDWGSIVRSDFLPYKIEPAIFDSPNGKIKQYPLPLTISSLPVGAVGNFNITLKTLSVKGNEIISIRIHTLSNYYDFPIKLE